MTKVSKSLVSSGTRSSSKKKINQLEQQLIEAEKANSNLKNENADLKGTIH